MYFSVSQHISLKGYGIVTLPCSGPNFKSIAFNIKCVWIIGRLLSRFALMFVIFMDISQIIPDSKVHGANIGPTWVLYTIDNFNILYSDKITVARVVIRVLLVGRSHGIIDKPFLLTCDKSSYWSYWSPFLCTASGLTGIFIMTSSKRNIFRVTGHLCGEFTGPGEFLAQRPVTRNFDVFFDLRLNKRLSKQLWGWWFETLL